MTLLTAMKIPFETPTFGSPLSAVRMLRQNLGSAGTPSTKPKLGLLLGAAKGLAGQSTGRRSQPSTSRAGSGSPMTTQRGTFERC